MGSSLGGAQLTVPSFVQETAIEVQMRNHIAFQHYGLRACLFCDGNLLLLFCGFIESLHIVRHAQDVWQD